MKVTEDHQSDTVIRAEDRLSNELYVYRIICIACERSRTQIKKINYFIDNKSVTNVPRTGRTPGLPSKVTIWVVLSTNSQKY